MKPKTDNKVSQKPVTTLSASLRNRVIFTVSVIFMVTTFINYSLSSHRSRVSNDEKTKEYLIYLKDNLEIPLWNMDRDWVKSICNSFTNNEMIGILKVTDGNGVVIFEKRDPKEPGLKPRTAALHFRDYYIGSIQLGISSKLNQYQNHKMILISVLTMILVLIGIAVSTRLILRKILEKPLKHLIAKIDEISMGIYDGSHPKFEHFEVITILEKFNIMSGKVKKRESSLIEANKKLESEIFDRKEVEKAHEESQARYRQLVEDLTMGLFRASPEIDGSFMMVNQALSNMLGYEDKDVLLNRPVTSIYKSPEMRRRFLDTLFSQGELQGFEHEFIRKDGSIMMGLVTCHVSWSEDGTPLYIDGIIEDITERKHFEIQRRQAQKMEALGTLAGGIAHDFNNILASIFGFTEVAKLRSTSGKEMSEPLDEILSAGIRARSLIKQIMTFSRQSEVKKIPISIVPVVKETIKFLRASLPAMIEIRFNLSRDDEVVIFGDPTQIHQILMNLCTNSAHAMETGGVLDISLDSVTILKKPESRFHHMAPGKYLLLKIKDTGHGIKPEHIERIFEPFFTTKQRGQGTGMGLAVVHGIVTDMGGQIMVENNDGQGTTFRIYIPVFQGEGIDLTKFFHTSARGKGKILFVDDEAGFLKSGTEILTEKGYEVTNANSGKEALSIFQTENRDIDMVITDMVMPKMTGLELAVSLKKIKPGIPVILCTGFSVSVNHETCRDAGIADVLKKPVLAQELIGSIEKNIILRHI